MFSLKKKFKQECRESERKCRDMLLAKHLAIEEHKPTELWNLVKKIKNWSRIQNRVENNIEPKEWLTHFQELLSEGEVAPDSFKLELHRLESEPMFSKLDYRISVSELNKAMKRLNTKSAPGTDKISGKHLCANYIELRQVFILFLNK